MNKQERQSRYFSKPFKEDKVRLIESGKITVSELSRIYEVSRAAVYKWLDKYGNVAKTERIVIEKKSEGSKTLELLKHIKELESALGRKDLENSYLRSVISKANDLFECDIEKK